MNRTNAMPLRQILPYIAAAAIFFLFAIMFFPADLFALDESLESMLPPPGFAKEWAMDGKISRYTKENLYTYIDGEAELYMPYGFTVLVSALYTKAGNAKTALVADIFQMGSAIDAFGIYSYYRNPAAEMVNIGSSGFIDESQLLFYKNRYFVRLSASGDNPSRAVFLACAEAIAQRLGGKSMPPEELELLKIPGIVPRTEKYTAQSVLGYAFFKKGFTADATLNGSPVKIFVILDESVQDAEDTINRYMVYLKEKGNEPRIDKSTQGVTLIAQDPLYKGVLVRQSGRYVFGITNLKTPP
jgi:hypothetical protein